MTGASAQGAPVVVLKEIDSTNAEVRRRAEAGQADPVWIVGLRQTVGRGRRGRAWETGTGNLAATLLLTLDKPPAEAAQVSFVAALAVADLLATYAPADLVALKWPNDPLLGGLKVSGILIESGQSPAGGLWLAVGIGINLVHKPEHSERPATCLPDWREGASPTPQEAAGVLSEAFARWLDVWMRLGFPAIADAWTARAHGLGQACTARLANETVEGVAEGLDDDGALRLRLADGTLRRITAGDVFFGGAS